VEEYLNTISTPAIAAVQAELTRQHGLLDALSGIVKAGHTMQEDRYDLISVRMAGQENSLRTFLVNDSRTLWRMDALILEANYAHTWLALFMTHQDSSVIAKQPLLRSHPSNCVSSQDFREWTLWLDLTKRHLVSVYTFERDFGKRLLVEDAVTLYNYVTIDFPCAETGTIVLRLIEKHGDRLKQIRNDYAAALAKPLESSTRA
jgi:hypothetical protein